MKIITITIYYLFTLCKRSNYGDQDLPSQCLAIAIAWRMARF